VPGETTVGVSSTGLEPTVGGVSTSALPTQTADTGTTEVSPTSHEPSTLTTVGDTSEAPVTGSQDDEIIEALEVYLETPSAQRPALAEQDFANAPLTAAGTKQATELLWNDHVKRLREERQTEHDARSLTWGEQVLRYDFRVFGEAPADGRSLYLSLHGGGEAEASVNDSQWENQKVLYEPDEGIYLAPRAPTNTWNLWHEAHIDPLFERLIANFVALEGVNPNRVYVMGYSAGGDGVYQLGPRMADHWAAAAAMAGHPNEAQPFSLRNIGFTVHVGAEDTGFDRNLIAVEWRDKLAALQDADPEGYTHLVEVHPGKGHWMDLEDAVAVPWMASFTRNPTPQHIVWFQDDILHHRFYWLYAPSPVKETSVTADLVGQEITLDSKDVTALGVRLRDDMLNLDAPITVRANGNVVFSGQVARTIAVLAGTLAERGDPALVFPAQIDVQW
jgi:poly(3-hydroxybutyrate) depolymerase